MTLYIQLLILIIFSSCSHIQSGKYVKVRKSDSIDSLAKEFSIPHAALLNANRGRKFNPGNYVFIPQDRGFMGRITGGQATYGVISKENFFKDPLLWPLSDQTKVSSGFGKLRWGKVHQGIDVPAPRGTAVMASEDGKVISTDYDGNGYGKYIIVKHSNGLETLYGHLHKRLVTDGQRVYRGQIIGLVGSTGKSTGPHLHYEVRKGGDPLDPFLYISKK